MQVTPHQNYPSTKKKKNASYLNLFCHVEIRDYQRLIAYLNYISVL